MDHAVVMAGGSGKRFWPESRMHRSKQFLDLTGRGPMIVETVHRLLPLVPPKNVWVVAGEKDAPHLSHRALGIPPGNIVLEPDGRNTAPAMALAAARIGRRDREAVIAATPADHAVADAASFRAVLGKGFRLARRTGRFVTLGIAPAHPATGYGYIERGDPFREGGDGVYLVRRFTEKPDLRTARRFLRARRFYWNSGVFVVRAETYRDRVARFLPAVHRELERALRDAGKKAFRERLRRAYARIPSVSVDYGILEKEDGILVIPSDFGWNDIGTWRSLQEFLGGAGENVTAGKVILADTRGALVRSDRGVVAVIGMEDVVVIRSGDAVLVCPRHRSEEVKGIVEEVQRRFPDLA
ncbi:MAG TPA: mannose-1-phosphate guanylyltransferase [Deltaproteobacteria bacterium]|nr:mannose-1-phosphate guanylyltransferase [Deltaproteobacteria bacterium]